MNFRTILILINVAAIAGLLGFIFFRVLSVRRNPETTTPENLTPFFDDEVLESAHLERVLGVALIALVIVVLGLLAYFIWEPFRETSAATGFNTQSIQRGAVLFANDQSPNYDSTVSLQCANCHGVDGGGGVATFTVKSEDPRCDPTAALTADLAAKEPYCLPHQVAWRAPALTLAGLRYSADQLTQIITYGRPGTPMPSWGIASGKGVLQEQGIQDLVNYVESLTVKSSKAQADAAKAAGDMAGVLAEARDQGRGGEMGRHRGSGTGDGPVRACRADGPRGDRHLRRSRGREAAGAGCRPGVGADHPVRHAGPDRVHGQLRSLPHPRLVVLRPQEPGRHDAARAHGWWRLWSEPHQRRREPSVPAAER